MTALAGRLAPSVSLILTATVDPRPVPALVRTRPEDRADEYRAALQRWSRESRLFTRIMWWENSNHQLAHQIAAEFSSAVSANVFTAEQFDSRLGKGYGEALMLEQIAAEGIDSFYGLKCTGRLSVANIRSLLTASLDSAPDIVIRLAQDFTHVDSRLFMVSSQLLREFTWNLGSEVNDDKGQYLEHAIARRVLQLAAKGARIGFWAGSPRYQGSSASTGLRYDSMASWLRWPVADLLYRIKRHGTFL